jgi:hypothetical protein
MSTFGIPQYLFISGLRGCTILREGSLTDYLEVKTDDSAKLSSNFAALRTKSQSLKTVTILTLWFCTIVLILISLY